MTSRRVPIPTSRPRRRDSRGQRLQVPRLLDGGLCEGLLSAPRHRVAIAFKAADKMWRVWKSAVLAELKLRLFRACIEPVLLYGSETWTLTAYLTKRIDGCYTKLLRKAKGWTFRDRKTNVELYGALPKDLRGRQAQTSCLRGTLRSVH